MTSQRSKSNSDATRSRTSPHHRDRRIPSRRRRQAHSSALLLLSAKLLGYKGKGGQARFGRRDHPHATLVHDDIIDEAQIRRGRPAANTQWGNSMCVLAGDWLYMQAFKIAVQERNFRILDVLVELTQQLVEGELLQMEKLGKLISLQEHLDLIYRKTACLFSVCMRVGGILGGATANQEERLANTDATWALPSRSWMMCSTSPRRRVFSASRLPATSGRQGHMSVIHALERCTAANATRSKPYCATAPSMAPLMPMS